MRRWLPLVLGFVVAAAAAVAILTTRDGAERGEEIDEASRQRLLEVLREERRSP